VTSVPDVVLAVSADGRVVAEAEVADLDGARALLAAARATGAHLAWAHCPADLAPAGFRPRPGYRRMVGPATRTPGAAQGASSPAAGSAEDDDGEITELAAADSAALWALAFLGQWGHRTPEEWPPDLPAGTITLCLLRDGAIAGLCRVEPETGLIDAPGLVPAQRDVAGYRALLAAALARVRTPTATMESWGDGSERVRSAEALGLRTAEYVQGWETELIPDSDR
jgi:hypothetical protein